MKQILITSEIKKMAKQYANNLFKDKGAAFVLPKAGLKDLIKDLKEVNDGLENKERYINYLKAVIKDYDKLKDLLPSEFADYKDKYDRIIAGSPLSAQIKYRKTPLPSKKAERTMINISEGTFYKLIVARMHYDDTRVEMGSYMKKLGINTCVYCNNSKAAVSQDGQEVYYPFDHGKPQSKYPFLCICFFNLYPCCNNCNIHKQDDEEKGFQLYTESNPVKDPFVFKITQSVLDDQAPLSIDVVFEARDATNDSFAKKYNKDFRIRELYNTEDEKRSCFQMIKLINKHRASYPTAISASFPSLPINRLELFTDVLGVKDDENIFTDLRKKLKLDTAKDAKLI